MPVDDLLDMFNSSDITTQVAYDCANSEDYMKMYELRRAQRLMSEDSSETISDEEIKRNADLARVAFGVVNGKPSKPSSKD